MTIGHCTGQNISITKFYGLLLLWRFLHSLVWFLGWGDLEVGLSWDPGPLLYLACLLPAWQLERERLEMGGNRKKGFERKQKERVPLIYTGNPPPTPCHSAPFYRLEMCHSSQPRFKGEESPRLSSHVTEARMGYGYIGKIKPRSGWGLAVARDLGLYVA